MMEREQKSLSACDLFGQLGNLVELRRHFYSLSKRIACIRWQFNKQIKSYDF